MEKILFKDDIFVYFIFGSEIVRDIKSTAFDSLNNIKHLDDVDILYYYINSDNYRLPVYYEYGNTIITGFGNHITYDIVNISHMTKDNTLINLNLFKDETGIMQR